MSMSQLEVTREDVLHYLRGGKKSEAIIEAERIVWLAQLTPKLSLKIFEGLCELWEEWETLLSKQDLEELEQERISFKVELRRRLNKAGGVNKKMNIIPMPTSTIHAISLSAKKGVKKTNVPQAKIKKDFGLEGDAHAGPSLSKSKGHRQVSLLALESIEKMRVKGLSVGPGDFAENITTRGLDLAALPLGAQLKIGSRVLLEISQLGKECHTPCAIFYAAGDCVMPKEGVFAKVIRGGTVKVGDKIKLEQKR